MKYLSDREVLQLMIENFEAINKYRHSDTPYSIYKLVVNDCPIVLSVEIGQSLIDKGKADDYFILDKPQLSTDDIILTLINEYSYKCLNG